MKLGGKEPLINRLVPSFIVLVFVLVIASFVFVAVIGYKAARELKGCTPAVVTETHNGKTSTSLRCQE